MIYKSRANAIPLVKFRMQALQTVTPLPCFEAVARRKFCIRIVFAALIWLVASPNNCQASAEAPKQGTTDWQTVVDDLFGRVLVDPLDAVLFFDLGRPYAWLTGQELSSEVPFVVFWLIAGAAFFTLRMSFINFRGFWHAVRLTKGDYDDPHDQGEVSHFQALSSALSGTLGLGNIGGVAIAIAAGGPGSIVWLIVAGLLGMASKFAECTLGQMYRTIDPSGVVSGGPMRYLHAGLADLGWPRTGRLLAIAFAVMCMGGAVGGGCAFQVGQSLGLVREQLPVFDRLPVLYGAVMALLVGVVIIGGIRRIAATAERVVPFMCGLYMLAGLAIILVNAQRVPAAIEEIARGALQPAAMYGGFLGVMVVGMRRAAFSNEAGIGSASIAHAAARTDEPVREGLVALLEPFIDTVVVCTLTGVVIVVTGVYDDPEFAAVPPAEQGARLTSASFATVASWFPALLTVAVVLFAYSTMITWSYYGERCWSYLFGQRSSLVYKLLFLGFVLLGSIVTAGKVLEFSDLMIFSMAIPNLVGVVLLSGRVRRALDAYWRRYRAGEFQPRH
ncbi:MAG: alanine:cation symporter family protein [Pirellulales bacterium]|nr:alanine:cation symporter family protein [Pirellulales bacterium]